MPNPINMTIRVRYAPSPTGLLHAGQIRTALFNYLFAHGRGTFILRIEDTDKERSKKEYEEAIYEDLEWMGIKPDESPVHGGNFGPYRQSERKSYKRYLEQLIQSNKAGFCDYLEEEEKKDPASFVHVCEYHGGFNKERKGIIRFKNPHAFSVIENKGPQVRPIKLSFDDQVRGLVPYPPKLLGDFSIAKDIDSPLYNFAVVVDDFEMQVGNIIRGEDHISNTFKQLLLIEALGFNVPKYAHLPLVLATDRSKLSKRNGAKSIREYRDEGYLPEALVNFIALLGWNPGGERELFSLSELINEFSLEKVNKSGAIFDMTKLDWMNGEYIRLLSVTDLTERLIPFMEKAGIETSNLPREKLERIVALEQPRLKTLAEIGDRVRFYFFAPLVAADLLIWKQMTPDDVVASLDESIDLVSKLDDHPSVLEVEKLLLEAATKRGDKGSLLWPLRAALTGLKASPGPFDVVSILGKTDTLERLQRAKSVLK